MGAPERARLGLSGRVRLVAGILTQTVTEWIADDAPRHGAALAYYAVFSVAPLLLVAISIAGILYGEDTARAEVSARLHELLGPQGASAVEGLLDRALPRGAGLLSTVVGVVTLFVGASTLFVQLRASLDHVWKVAPRPGGGLKVFVCRQGLGFLMVLFMGALLLASLVLGTLVSVAGDLVSEWLGLAPGGLGFAWPLLSFTLVTVAFATMFKVLPDVTVAWRHVWVGALATAALFTLGRFAIATWLAHAGVGTAYGAAGSLVAFLVWVYWSAQILLLGAEFTQVYARFGAGPGVSPRPPPPARPPPRPRAG